MVNMRLGVMIRAENLINFSNSKCPRQCNVVFWCIMIVHCKMLLKTFVSCLPDDGDTRHQPGPELRGVEVRGGGVEEDEDGLLEEGPGAGADQDHDQQRQGGVQVVLGQHI